MFFFIYSFRHILRTTSPLLLIFIPHILESIHHVKEQITIFYYYLFFFYKFPKWATGLEEREILKKNSTSYPLQLFGYAIHYTYKSHEFTYHWYKGWEITWNIRYMTAWLIMPSYHWNDQIFFKTNFFKNSWKILWKFTYSYFLQISR